jgi:hypothetical protein
VKIKPHKEIVSNIRLAIKQTKEALDENKKQRKKLIRDIQRVKSGIRDRERFCSELCCASIDTFWPRTDLDTQRKQLDNLRQNLIGAEVYREVELAKFRALHKQLDKFNEPFDPERKAEKYGK